MTLRRLASLMAASLALACAALGQEEVLPAAEGLLRPDDQVAFLRNGDIYMVSGEGRGLQRLTNTTDREVSLRAAPDGSALVYESFDAATNEFAIYTHDLASGMSRQIIPVGHAPSWSPDGGWLAYTANVPGGAYEVFVCDRHGQNIQRLTDTPTSELYPVWSPDGSRLAYLRDLPEATRRSQVLVIRDAAGGEVEVTTLTDQQVTGLSWAPGANLLLGARVTEAQVRDELYEIRPEPGTPRRLTEGLDGETAGAWLPEVAGLLCSQVSRSASRPIVRTLDGTGSLVPGTESGDLEPTLIPGPSRRAPTVYVRNRRSFYLPAPRIVGDDVLLPLQALAPQIGWMVTPEGATLRLTMGDRELDLDPTTGALSSGDAPLLLNPLPVLIDQALLVPVGALAEHLALTVDWNPTARVLRVTTKEATDEPSERPETERVAPSDPEPGIQ